MIRIKCFIKRPDSDWYATHISMSLGAIQNAVGGYIETVTMPKERVVIICNEEGLLRGLPYCCTIDGISFCGNVVVLGYQGDEFAPVPMSLKEWRERVK